MDASFDLAVTRENLTLMTIRARSLEARMVAAIEEATALRERLAQAERERDEARARCESLAHECDAAVGRAGWAEAACAAWARAWDAMRDAVFCGAESNLAYICQGIDAHRPAADAGRELLAEMERLRANVIDLLRDQSSLVAERERLRAELARKDDAIADICAKASVYAPTEWAMRKLVSVCNEALATKGDK